MSIALDVIVFVIVGLTLFFVIKKGFVKSLLELMSGICSLIVAKLYAPTVSNLFHKFVDNSIGKKIEDVFQKMIENTESSAGPSKAIESIIEKYNLEFLKISESTQVDNAVAAFVDSVVGVISYCLAFFLIFIGVLLLFKILTPLLSLVFKLPVLKTLDKTFAAVLGVILSVIYSTVFVSVMQLLIPSLSVVYPNVFGDGLVSSTFVFKYLYNMEWLNILLM